ncbi:MAG: hypothetical protein ACSLFQ_21495 [Thermoanaerobaculia bacterium]
MKSNVAEELRLERMRVELARTPGERLRRALEIGEQELQIFMTANGLSREAAHRALEANRHKGRRPSCASTKAH